MLNMGRKSCYLGSISGVFVLIFCSLFAIAIVFHVQDKQMAKMICHLFHTLMICLIVLVVYVSLFWTMNLLV